MLGGFHKEAARFRLVGQVGLEPTMVKPADLQSAAIAARRLTHMVEPAGIEPEVPVSKTGALTAWPYPNIDFFSYESII